MKQIANEANKTETADEANKTDETYAGGDLKPQKSQEKPAAQETAVRRAFGCNRQEAGQ